LKGELTGILNWALDGLHRLVIENGNRFTRVSSSDLASPVGAFVREQCITGAAHQINVDDLYAAYKQWAEDNGHTKHDKSTFGRNLRAAIPAITLTRPREADRRLRIYAGIDLRVAGDA
jgi:putative DNA primase/helicase